jgi:hypothetical protein
MKQKSFWTKIISNIGFAFLIIGALDPLEGSLLILPGSGFIVLGAYMKNQDHQSTRFRLWMFILILLGVAALWIISMMDGLGGDTGHSMWWALLFLPYLIAWSLSVWAKDSPKWVVWGGIAVSSWYFVILLMVLQGRFSEPSPEMLAAPVTLFILGLFTIAGSVWRLKHSPK